MVFFSLLVAMGTTLHVVEGMIPNPFPFPGVKLGLANIVTLVALCFYGFREGLAVAVVRVVLGSLVGGVFLSPGFLLSLAGAVFSTMVMSLLLQSAWNFSLKGVSVTGAICHNLGQLMTAAVLIHSWSIFYYLPFLLLAGIATGLITGYLLELLIERLEKSMIFPRLLARHYNNDA
jgi:heptaprenyl diphosphate synthase